MDLRERVILTNGFHDDGHYPAMFVNITNRCTLECTHCFVYRDDNPNEKQTARREIPDDELVAIIEALRDRHGVYTMLWMGGEPLLRRKVVERGVPLFERNTIVTNGTIALVDLGPGPRALYVVSLDGPPEINDAVRGRGVFDRVMRTIERLPRRLLDSRPGSVHRHPREPGPPRGARGHPPRDADRLGDVLLLRATRR
ncbi:MAG: radical SAM protein [Acidimicrobiia bacterium]|nr:radical SAM protein [Acidimicrobiia bacterium]